MKRSLSPYLVHRIKDINLKSQRRDIFANLVYCNNQNGKKQLVYKKNSFCQVLQYFHKILEQMSSGGMKKVEKTRNKTISVFLTILGLKFHKRLT